MILDSGVAGEISWRNKKKTELRRATLGFFLVANVSAKRFKAFEIAVSSENRENLIAENQLNSLAYRVPNGSFPVNIHAIVHFDKCQNQLCRTSSKSVIISLFIAIIWRTYIRMYIYHIWYRCLVVKTWYSPHSASHC